MQEVLLIIGGCSVYCEDSVTQLQRERERTQPTSMLVVELIVGMPIPTAHGIGLLLEEVAIMIAGDGGETQCHQSIRSSARMQSAGEQIAEVHHGVDALPFDVFEDGVERRDVAVNIGNESYSHKHRIAAWAFDCNTATLVERWRLRPRISVFDG